MNWNFLGLDELELDEENPYGEEEELSDNRWELSDLADDEIPEEEEED